MERVIIVVGMVPRLRIVVRLALGGRLRCKAGRLLRRRIDR